MMTSCVNEFMNEETVSIPENALRITTSCAGTSRASSPYEGDDLNLSLFYSDNDAAATSFDFFNTQWTKAEDGTWSSSEPVFWKDRTTKAKIYAFVPYSDLGGTVNAASLKRVSFSVLTNQNSDDAFLKSDFASYGGTDLDPNDYINKTFPIVLTHRLAQMKVKVSFNDSYTGDKNITSVKINAETSCTINVIEGKVVESAEGANTTDASAAVSPKDVTAMNNGENEYAAILPPQNISKVIVEVDGKTYTYNASEGITHKLESNKIYTLNLSLGKKGLSLGKVTLEDWTEGELVLDRTSGVWAAEEPDLVSNIYEVSKPEHLAWISQKVSANNNILPANGIKLMNDIDMSDHYFTPCNITKGLSAGTEFNGNGKKIIGLTIKDDISSGKYNVLGLFGEIKSMKVHDLIFVNPVIIPSGDGVINSGVFAGRCSGGNFYNVQVYNAYAKLDITKNNQVFGGILGQQLGNSIVYASIFDGVVKINGTNKISTTRVGTIAGQMGQSIIIGCCSSGRYISEGNISKGKIGVFAGEAQSYPTHGVRVDACYSTVEYDGDSKIWGAKNENTNYYYTNEVYLSDEIDIPAINEYIEDNFSKKLSIKGSTGTAELSVEDRLKCDIFLFVENTDDYKGLPYVPAKK